MIYVLMYLSAIILANLSVAYFGVGAVIINAFLFIGLDLTARDKLHEIWHKKGLVWKMGLLIAAGSVISWLLNRNAGMVAIASFVAFCCAAIVDTVTYQFLFKKSWMVKINGSNILSALTDSVIFPTVAFGTFMPLIILGQFAAKVIGGFVWALIIGKTKGTVNR